MGLLSKRGKGVAYDSEGSGDEGAAPFSTVYTILQQQHMRGTEEVMRPVPPSREGRILRDVVGPDAVRPSNTGSGKEGMRGGGSEDLSRLQTQHMRFNGSVPVPPSREGRAALETAVKPVGIVAEGCWRVGSREMGGVGFSADSPFGCCSREAERSETASFPLMLSCGGTDSLQYSSRSGNGAGAPPKRGK